METGPHRKLLDRAVSLYRNKEHKFAEHIANTILKKTDKYNAEIFLLLGSIHFDRGFELYNKGKDTEQGLREYKIAEYMYERGLEHIPEILGDEQRENKLVKADILYGLAMLYDRSDRISKFNKILDYCRQSTELTKGEWG